MQDDTVQEEASMNVNGQKQGVGARFFQILRERAPAENAKQPSDTENVEPLGVLLRRLEKLKKC